MLDAYLFFDGGHWIWCAISLMQEEGRWSIDALKFEMPVLAAPMDSVMSPATAIAMGRLGGLGVLDLEGLWTRYEDAEAQLARIRDLDPAEVNRRLRAAAAYGTSLPSATNQVGVVGFCWGGSTSFAFAVDYGDLAAAVVY